MSAAVQHNQTRFAQELQEIVSEIHSTAESLRIKKKANG
jgi:hypothetical protein